MPLTSILFRESKALQACAVNHGAHVVPGASGEHVARIQKALEVLDDAVIDAGEVKARTYGKSTAAAVLAYKTVRKIINTTYQKTPDNIVGIMTIAAMDAEMKLAQQRPPPGPLRRCSRLT